MFSRSDFEIYKMTMVYDNSVENVLKTQMINASGGVVTSLIMNGLYCK